MKRLILPLVLSVFLAGPTLSQEIQSAGIGQQWLGSATGSPISKDSSHILSTYRAPKRPGHYTANDWRALVDSLWGPGLPTSTKLEIFDTFWGGVDRGYAGFPNLSVNWDSLRTRYRPEVQAGVSRGRFAGIMSQLWLPLQDTHLGIEDHGIDSIDGHSVHDTYLPGIPCFWPTGWNQVGNFGAALTPMPDSSLLVYRAIASHPLGLVPGDIILGYDRISWKRLVRELLKAELPTHNEEEIGSTTRSWTHGLLNCAGKNWGLFDTIDVVKYSTGDTLHLSTAPLAGLAWGSLYGTEQIAVPGVRMPDRWNRENCTWGVVENTSVGYIYIYNWLEGTTGTQFAAALKDLLTVKKVTGLIIDSRFNIGGYLALYNSTLDPLFNFNPADRSRWRAAARLDPADHFSFSYSAMFDSAFQMKPDYYDRPVAFLTGPATASGAEHIAFQMRFHPMVRMFGLPTNGSVPALGPNVYEVGKWGSWDYTWLAAQAQSLVYNEGFLVHKAFPVDEEVWLTREGAAKGEDDVVKRALGWIRGLAYAHDLKTGKNAIKRTGDSVVVTATVENPEKHALLVSAIIGDANGQPADSVVLLNDGQHGDGAAGDSIWGATVTTPSGEGFFGISVRTDDLTTGTFRRFPNAKYVASAGPLTCAGYTITSTDTVPNPGNRLVFKIKLKNNGSVGSVPGVAASVTALDSGNIAAVTVQQYGDISPGAEALPTTSLIIQFSSTHPGMYVAQFAVDVSSMGMQYWRDTMRVVVTGINGEEIALPTQFSLSQNYPNPFNPSTTIKYELPKSSMVKLIVYDLLGREVAVLVNERRDAGVHEVRFDGSNLASGVYFYRLQAGDFVQAKGLVITK